VLLSVYYVSVTKFITSFTSARHLPLSWVISIQPMLPHPSSWRRNVLLSSHLRLGLPSGLFPHRSPRQNPICNSHVSHTCYFPRPHHLLDLTTRIIPRCWQVFIPTRKETSSEACQGRARFQQHRDASCHQVPLPPAKQGAEGNSCHSDRNISFFVMCSFLGNSPAPEF